MSASLRWQLRGARLPDSMKMTFVLLWLYTQYIPIIFCFVKQREYNAAFSDPTTSDWVKLKVTGIIPILLLAETRTQPRDKNGTRWKHLQCAHFYDILISPLRCVQSTDTQSFYQRSPAAALSRRLIACQVESCINGLGWDQNWFRDNCGKQIASCLFWALPCRTLTLSIKTKCF